MILGWESVFYYIQMWFKPTIDLEIVNLFDLYSPVWYSLDYKQSLFSFL